MSEAPDPARDAFFVGWAPSPPPALRRFLAVTAAVILGLLLGAAIIIGAASRDVAGRDFAQAPGPPPVADLPVEGGLTGILMEGPSPLLRVTPSGGRAPSRTLFLSGDGKRGAPLGDPPPYGRLVQIEGYVLRRGSLEMLVASGPPMALSSEAVPMPPAEPLGRWRVTGEICDGKCGAGAMRPGAGLSHRACAILCLDGDIPAVFVATSPVAGQRFLLLADRDGRAPMPAFRHLVGVRVTLEGEVERRGDLLVFRAEQP